MLCRVLFMPNKMFFSFYKRILFVVHETNFYLRVVSKMALVCGDDGSRLETEGSGQNDLE